MRNREYFLNQFDWLYHLQNDLGNNNLEICCSGLNSKGEIYFTKRYKFIDLCHSNPDDLIATDTQGKIKKPVLWFILNATHRSILDIEIVIDLDDKGEYDSIKDKAIDIIKNLIKNHPDTQFKVYFTGSKSYHIHIFIPELRDISNRDELKRIFLSELVQGDPLKVGRNLIALEGAPHYKSGRIKEEVFL